MQTEFSLLVVEDSPDLVASWKRDIEEFNESTDNALLIRPVFTTNLRETEEALKWQRIDAAVVDLRIPFGETVEGGPGGPGEENGANGNQVLKDIIKDLPIPIVIYSGHTNDLDDIFDKPHIDVRQKEGGGQMSSLLLLAEKINLIQAIQFTRAIALEKSAEIFHHSIWPRWQHHWKGLPDSESLKFAISRQILGHVSDIITNITEDHYPEEFYIIPPIKSDSLDTGDLFQIGDSILVLLTPRCNLSQGAVGNLLLATCESDSSEDWASIESGFKHENVKKQDAAITKARKRASQDVAVSRHFLPKIDELGPWMVHFDKIRCISVQELTAQLDGRLASIAPHFVPNLVQRFSAYWGRIGQPNIDPKLLIEGHLRRFIEDVETVSTNIS